MTASTVETALQEPASIRPNAPSSALADLDQRRAGLMVLGMMSPEDFDRQLQVLSVALARIETLKVQVLKEGVDYGIIPGTDKPTLLKPGAEKLLFVGRLVPELDVKRIVGANENEPELTYLVTCRVHLGNTDGPIISEGVGTANSWERKHRYRRAQRSCPECGRPALMASKFPPKGAPKGTEPGWWCNIKRGGCGRNFLKDDDRIIHQSLADEHNPDPFDLDNTLAKMAKKRALVDATLTATASSGTFTQDVEDLHEHEQRGAPTRANLEARLKAAWDRGALNATQRKGFAEEVLGAKVVSISGLSMMELRRVMDVAETTWPLAEVVDEPQEAEGVDA